MAQGCQFQHGLAAGWCELTSNTGVFWRSMSKPNQEPNNTGRKTNDNSPPRKPTEVNQPCLPEKEDMHTRSSNAGHVAACKRDNDILVGALGA